MVRRYRRDALDPAAHHEVFRVHRTLIVKTLGLSARKSPVQTILILLVESGLVYLAFQVSDLLIYAHRIFKVLIILIDCVLGSESCCESCWL